MTIITIKMKDLKKSEDYIRNEYYKINPKTNEFFEKTKKMILGHGLKSKIFRKMLGKQVDIVIGYIDVLESMPLILNTEMKKEGDFLIVTLRVNDMFLKTVEDYRRTAMTFGLYWKFKDKGVDLDSMKSHKFIKKLAKTGKSYANYSEYKIEGEKNGLYKDED